MILCCNSAVVAPASLCGYTYTLCALHPAFILLSSDAKLLLFATTPTHCTSLHLFVLFFNSHAQVSGEHSKAIILLLLCCLRRPKNTFATTRTNTYEFAQ